MLDRVFSVFTHLHLHTEYSLLDGMCRIQDVVKRAKELGMDSLAITDHGVMYGVIDFYLAAKEAGIRPILGCEIYVAPADRQSRGAADKSHNHLVLLAKNDTGYRNLLQLTSRAHLEGFYYKPRVDKELLLQHNEGLVALSACGSGEVPRLIQEGRREDAKRAALWYKETFEDYFFELQDHAIPELEIVNRELISLSHELNIPLVVTNDVHYVKREDAPIHEILLCIQTGNTVNDSKRMKMQGDSFYLRTEEEMAALFPSFPEAVTNTRRIAEMCDLRLEFNRLNLPDFETPGGQSSHQYLSELCWEGLRRRYPELTERIEQRLNYELDVIQQTHFANYFLVVWDFASYARKHGIPFGVRGSAAASIVLYCLGITDVDPMAHNLVFERFLNIERKELPDIDMDFADDRRDEVINYVANKYGHDHVAQIITFGTLGAKAAIRDVGRALGMAYSDVDRVARLVPSVLNITLERALGESQELQELYNADRIVRNLVDTAMRLEGTARHASTHAAGVVISKDPLTQHVPLQKPTRGDDQSIAMTQFAMDIIAKIGLLKMDLLGLSNLTVLGRARELIAQYRGIDLDLHHIPLDDAKTFELLAAGETTGVFQLESAGMRKYIKDLKPTCFSDLAAMIALYRPGPLQHIPTFINAKHGLQPIRYPHPALEKILGETHGVIVYQDQVLFILQALAGYSLGRADIVRKAMGKKIPELMREERQHFIQGAKKLGHSEKAAAEVFNLIEPFAGYAFNKAHSVSYAVIAYQTAYLKANYSVEYMTALMIIYSDQPEKIASTVAECNRLGIRILPPSVNNSDLDFSIEKTLNSSLAIRFGLATIKNVGAAAVKPMVLERVQNGAFKNIEDFCRRVDLKGINKRVLESLIKAGAMDCFGARGALLHSIDRIVAMATQEQKLKETGQSTMFDLWGATVPTPLPVLELAGRDVPLQEKLTWEKELLGVYMSEHPFNQAARNLKGAAMAYCGQIGEEMVGQSIEVAGMVVSTRQLLTKDKRPFLSAVIEDLTGTLEVTVWTQVYERTRDLWTQGSILRLKGKVKARNDQAQLVCDAVSPYQQETADKIDNDTEEVAVEGPILGSNNGLAASVQPPTIRRMLIRFIQSGDAEADLTRLRDVFSLLKSYPGQDFVNLIVVDEQEEVELDVPDTVDCCPMLRQELAKLVGTESIRVE